MASIQKILFILFTLLISSPNLQAQEISSNSLIWRLNASSGNEVYLAGTLPIDNIDFIEIPKSLQQAFDKADLIVFDKSPMDLKAEYQRLFAEKGFYPENEMLAEHLDTKLYKKLEKRLEELESPLGHMPRMKPWLIAISLNNLETEAAGYSRKALKEYYFHQATEEEKEISTLDNVLSEQSLLSNLSEEAQIEYLAHSLKNSRKNIRQQSKLFKTWKKGNFKKFSSLVRKQQKRLPSDIKEIQNKIQQSIPINQLVEIVNSGQNLIIFIDASQLVGKNSLLKKLKSAGVEITEL